MNDLLFLAQGSDGRAFFCTGRNSHGWAGGSSPPPSLLQLTKYDRGMVPLVELLTQMRTGVRPGPMLHRWPLLTYYMVKREKLDNIWSCRGNEHSHALLAEVGVRVRTHVHMCALVHVCAIW